MTIKARLQITTVIAILLALGIGSFIFLVNQGLNGVIEENRRADEIVKGVFELNILTNDYLLRRSERTSDQWWLRYNSISRLLIEAGVSDDSKKQARIGILRENHKSIATTFFQLITVLGRVPKEERSTASIELEDRLVSQLSARSQTMVASASALARENRQELTQLQQQLSLFVLAAIFILAAIIATSSWLTMTGVLRPLLKLQGGASIIGKGNLKHRIDIKSKDEIGQVAMSFNAMAVTLQKSYESLEGKVRERTAELEIAKNKSETLLASIGDGVFGIDKEQKIIYFNKRAEEISGYKEAEVIGKQYYDILKFLKVKDKSENIEFIRTALKGEATSMTDHTVLIRKDKKEISVADSASPIKDKEGKTLGAIVVFRDATKEKELERARAELVSFAGHQLKAPLTYMAGNVELLENRALDTESKELIGGIATGVKEMKKLVSDVLNISRIEQGSVTLRPEPTQLEEVVEEIIKESSSVAKQRNVTVEFTKSTQPLPELDIDPQYIHEVFKNIISNAIKYTKDTVTVSFEKKDGNILFTCSDNGIGIPQDEQPKVFSKFFVASNVSKTGIKGTGLGLSIAKVLIERMNGRVWFESKEKKGTTFYISLPLL